MSVQQRIVDYALTTPPKRTATKTNNTTATNTAEKQGSNAAAVTPGHGRSDGASASAASASGGVESGSAGEGVSKETKKHTADGEGKAEVNKVQLRVNCAKGKGKPGAKISFSGDGGQDTAISAANKAVQRSVIPRDAHYLQVECKATPTVSPKKAIRSSLGLLLGKVSGIEILNIKDRWKKIRGKGGLSTNWNEGLDGYVHIKGGIEAMTRVCSKHKQIHFTTIVSSLADFDMKGRLAGLSIDLEDEELTFEARTLQCLEDKDDIMILFAYGAALGEKHCKQQVKEALAEALSEKEGKPTPAPQIKV